MQSPDLTRDQIKKAKLARLEFLKPHPELRHLCQRYFEEEISESPLATWAFVVSGLTVFSRFLREHSERAGSPEAVLGLEQIDAALMREFERHLVNRARISRCKVPEDERGEPSVRPYVGGQITRKSVAVHYKSVKAIFSWALGREVLSTPTIRQRVLPGLRINVNRGPKGPGRRPLTSEQLQQIATAALLDVDTRRQRHAEALVALAAFDHQPPLRKYGEWTHSREQALAMCVRRIGITKPTGPSGAQTQLHKHYKTDFNGLINEFAPVGVRSLIPFLVYVAWKSSINVCPLIRMRRDCLKSTDSALGIAVLHFRKPRSGPTHAGKQHDYPKEEKDNVPDVIRFVLEYTSPWIEHTPETERDQLWLYRNKCRGGTALNPDHDGELYRDGLAKWIEAKGLPRFSLADLRAATATEAYLRLGMNLRKTQFYLDHRDEATTAGYVHKQIVRHQHDMEIHRGINEVFDRVMDPSKQIPPPAGEEQPSAGWRQAPADLGSLAGQVCHLPHACLWCPHCYLFVEDVPGLLGYRAFLIGGKAGTPSGAWEELHGDTVRQIERVLLARHPGAATEAGICPSEPLS